jgi:hypothetical protein
VDIVGDPDWDVPFGQDRLVLLYLATQAIRYQTSIISFRSGAEIPVGGAALALKCGYDPAMWPKQILQQLETVKY